MQPDDLVRVLTSLSAAMHVVRAIADPQRQAVHGWDLTHWTCEVLPNQIRFWQRDAHGTITALVEALSAPARPLPPAPYSQCQVRLG